MLVKSMNSSGSCDPALGVGASRHHGPVALTHKVQVVVVRRGAESIVPGQEDRDFAIGRQRNHVVGLRTQSEDVGRIAAALKEVQMSGGGDSGDGLSIDAGIGVGAKVMLVRGIAEPT